MIPENPKSALELFLSLVKIPSPSKKEKVIIDQISAWLSKRGIVSSVDDAYKITGGDTGNLIVRRGSGSQKKVLFLAHVDTVEDGNLIEPVIKNGIVKSKGNTILGADNKAAVASLLYLLTKEQEPEEADAIIVFTTSEEKGVMGAGRLQDISSEINYAFPVDGSDPVGTFTTKALGHYGFVIRVKGKRAHAAKNPEDGIHAIQAASDIVAGLPIGKSPDFIINIGRIEGGGETNIIPDTGEIFGEVRSYSENGIKKGIDLIRNKIAEIGEKTGTKIDLEISEEEGIPPFSGSNNQDCINFARAACQEIGLSPNFISCPATFEANLIDSFSLPTLGVSSGGSKPHSNDESLNIKNLEKLPKLLQEILRQVKAAE